MRNTPTSSGTNSTVTPNHLVNVLPSSVLHIRRILGRLLPRGSVEPSLQPRLKKMKNWHSNRHLKYIAARFAVATLIVLLFGFIFSVDRIVWISVTITAAALLTMNLWDWWRNHSDHSTRTRSDSKQPS